MWLKVAVRNLLWLPCIILPRRQWHSWTHTLTPSSRYLRSLSPWVFGIVWKSVALAWTSLLARPYPLTRVLSVHDTACVVTWMRNVSLLWNSVSEISSTWLHYLFSQLLAHQPLLAWLCTGSILWLEMVLISILLLGPLHVAALQPDTLPAALRRLLAALDALATPGLVPPQLATVAAPMENLYLLLERRVAERTSALSAALEKAERQSRIDALTQMYNRRAFFECLDKQIHSNSEAWAMVLLDIDHFKKTNDTYGHPTGDKVLQALANVLRATVRSGDVVGRLGGEEFGILLTACSETQATQACERLRQAVERSVVVNSGSTQVTATISLGCSTIAGGTRALARDALYERTDAALYEAKHAGRNRVVRVPFVSPSPSGSAQLQRLDDTAGDTPA